LEYQIFPALISVPSGNAHSIMSAMKAGLSGRSMIFIGKQKSKEID